MTSPILVALDLPDAGSAESLARRLQPHVGGFKVGLELIMSEGPWVISQIASLGLPVFADAKLHDIPNTVAAAARALASRGARWVTVHTSGGSSMLQAAATGLAEGSEGRPVGALGVTVLTSLDESDLTDTGQEPDVFSQVTRLATLAADAGLEGVICSPGDVPLVKGVSGDLLAVTPGIRASGSSTDDQKRVATAAEAIASGADLLVVGRAITAHARPEEAAQEIAGSVESALRGRSDR